jgi:hypothetical protein
MFALLFLIGQALVYSSEATAVRYARCGRTLDLTTHRDRYPRAGPAGLRGGTHLPAETGRLPRQQVMARDNAATPAASRAQCHCRSGERALGTARLAEGPARLARPARQRLRACSSSPKS